MASTIRHPAQWLCHHADGTQVVHDLELSYDPSDPYAIQITFLLDVDEPDFVVAWTISRDLLTEGITSWAGDGDVRVQVWVPLPRLVSVELLDSHDGRWSRFLARRDDLADFLRHTYTLVPAGTEQMDVDTAVERLLTGTAPGGE
ncbi:SsgA family sporulation/cell division regulator [Nocardiopsis sp. NPDC049922]|uniref:SsgA family sporulation/cell division regulator n=1 Tax=Nocardiopsis sp. NPDC049922 TaxID=3155157 RepID=UPI003402F03C